MKHRHDLAKSQFNLVHVYRQMGRLDEGETAFLKTMTLLDSLLAGDPKNVEYVTLQARCYQNVALVYHAQGRTADAEAACRKALDLNHQLARDHPNVVEAHDAGEQAETVYLVMKFIEGTDLGRLVRERGPLPVAEACALACQAAHGLHGDLRA